jgi:DNA mismatch repair protein MutS
VQQEFHGILFNDAAEAHGAESAKEPAFFTDLNLDQIVTSIVEGREEYNLKPFFYVPLKSGAAVRYRQEIIRDLQRQPILAHIGSFAQLMRTMREQLGRSSKAHYALQKHRWFLDAVDTYCVGVGCLGRDLGLAEVRSEGLLRFRAHLASYLHSEKLMTIRGEVAQLKADLAGIRYRLHIEGLSIEVSHYGSEPDYGEEVAQTFEKFRQGAAKSYEFDFPGHPDINHVEAAVLDRVALLHPQVFAALEQFCRERADYLDQTIRTFDREVQFYVAVLEQVGRLERGGLAFCLPVVSERDKAVECHEVFDLSLAIKLQAEASRLVRNDFHLRDAERILVVSGANQGGKTTFARTVGQLHYLAILGCPVAARDARLFLFDRMFTHFEREEDLGTLRSKLEDDLVRIHRILEQASARSLLIMNESFSSATLQDAIYLGKEVLRRVMDLDLLCVFVTFLDELSALGEQTVSMVSTVRAEDPTRRTFKIVRMPADGLAYAAAIAEKYHLGYESVKRRVAS